MKKIYQLISAATLTFACVAIPTNETKAQANLFVNGDFSAGNTGFTSGLIYSSTYSPCYYYVGSTFFSLSDPTLIDHTPTSDGMYMSVDGCSPATMLWEQTIPSIQTNCNYAFSFWATRADYIAPVFEIHMIGNVTGDVVVATLYDILYSGVWTWDQYVPPVWNSGANTSVTVRIVNLETNGAGNDFGLDDFAFLGECGTNSVATFDNNLFNLSLSPNPASESVSISYTLNEKSKVSVSLFSIEGKILADLFSEEQLPGKHEQKLLLDLNLSKGIYLLNFNVNGVNSFSKLVVE